MNTLIERSRKNMKNKKGFTLIELIVVIVIIGILAAIVIPRLSGFTETAQKGAIEADAKTILTAASAAFAEDRTVDAADITRLAGPLKGTMTTSPSATSTGAISFTYTLGKWTATANNSVITITP